MKIEIQIKKGEIMLEFIKLFWKFKFLIFLNVFKIVIGIILTTIAGVLLMGDITSLTNAIVFTLSLKTFFLFFLGTFAIFILALMLFLIDKLFDNLFDKLKTEIEELEKELRK